MPQQHAINGTNINYISQAIWEQPAATISLNVIQVHSRWYTHTWLSNVMTVTEWETFRGLRGTIATITTTDPADPNNANYVTYSGAIIKDISYNRHESLNIIGAKIEFLLRV